MYIVEAMVCLIKCLNRTFIKVTFFKHFQQYSIKPKYMT